MAIRAVESGIPLLMVEDMNRSVAWYRDVLGFEVVSTWEPEGHLAWAMLRLGEARLMLNIRSGDSKPSGSPPPATPRQDFVIFFECANVDEAYEELRSKPCTITPPETAFYGMRQIELTDPDGFQLCFQHPVPVESANRS